MRSPLGFLLVVPLACASPVFAQGQGSSNQRGHFTGDGLARYEWTRDIPQPDGSLGRESRWRLQLRPGFEAGVGPVTFGLGAELNYSKDRNDQPPPGQEKLLLVRDNYRSRDARLDLAYGRLHLGALTAQGGRFVMPLPITEMIWDRDLRPQGGSATLRFGGQGSPNGLSLSALYAKGSHVFEDQSVLYGGSAEISFANEKGRSFQAVGSLLRFADLQKLDVALRRQNAQLDGAFAHDYRVADVVVRIGMAGPMLLVADYCWNTARSADNRGLWLGATLGAFDLTAARVEYTYARVDREATVAAFTSDDFYWGTGWEGHRVDFGRMAGPNRSMHAIAQWQRPREGSVAGGGPWVKRWRLEWRTRF